MEKLAYQIKARHPRLFEACAIAGERLSTLRYGRKIRKALKVAFIEGTVHGEKSILRPLERDDWKALESFLDSLPKAHLEFFRPHSFDRITLNRVLSSRAYLCYGLFISRQMQAYALLKVSPTGSGYLGRLVHPSLTGYGLGGFLSTYLRWQAALTGLRARCTISQKNEPSLRSHKAVCEYRILARLPKDYLLIEFPPEACLRPTLRIE